MDQSLSCLIFEYYSVVGKVVAEMEYRKWEVWPHAANIRISQCRFSSTVKGFQSRFVFEYNGIAVEYCPEMLLQVPLHHPTLMWL